MYPPYFPNLACALNHQIRLFKANRKRPAENKKENWRSNSSIVSGWGGLFIDLRSALFGTRDLWLDGWEIALGG